MLFNWIKTFVLLFGLSLLVLFLGHLFGGYEGVRIAFVIAIIMNIIAYFFSEKIVLRMYKAKKLDPTQYGWIYDTVEELAKTMDIPMPKLWIIHSPMANAFATGRNPKHASVAITSGIINLLDKNELRGVLAHELSHVKNRDILIATIAATIATTISYASSMLRYAAYRCCTGPRSSNGRSNPVLMLLVSMLMPIAALLMQLSISRSREYLADESGGKYSKDPLALASALEKLHSQASSTSPGISSIGKESTAPLFIVHPFSKKGMLTLFSTHPPVGKRIEHLRNLYEKMFHIK